MTICLKCGSETKVKSRKYCSKKCSASHRQSKFNDELIDKIVKEYTIDKLEIIEISKQNNISVTYVFKLLKKRNIPLRGSYIDYTGRIFGKLTVVKLHSKPKERGKHCYWECLCECNRKEIIISATLATCKRLSCTICSKQKRDSTKPELADYHWTNIKRGAASRKIEFNITKEYAYQLFLKQNKKCALSGLEIQFAKNSFQASKYGTCTASLDRIDSSKGYIEGNVQWVHKKINIMKLDMPESDFIFYCKKVGEYAKSTTVSTV